MSATPVSLLERLRDHPDSEAWREFVDLYTPLLRHWLRRYALQSEDAEDLVQEVLGIVVRELPRFRHNQRTGAFRHWLRTILVHRLRDFWRARDHRPGAASSREALHRLEQLEDPASDLSRLWEQEHDRHVVHRLLDWIRADFQPTTWRAFEGVMLAGEKPAEVAARLGISVNAVLLAKSHVLRRLRQEARDLLD